MPDGGRRRPLPIARHVNGLVAGGLLTILVIPIGSTVADYESRWWPHLLTVATAIIAFTLLAIGLRLGPTTDDRTVARQGVPAQAVVERAVGLSMSQSRGGGDRRKVAQVVRLDLRVEAEGEPATRVRLRRWVDADKLDQLEPGAVLAAKVLPGRPEDPALGLRGPDAEPG